MLKSLNEILGSLCVIKTPYPKETTPYKKMELFKGLHKIDFSRIEYACEIMTLDIKYDREVFGNQSLTDIPVLDEITFSVKYPNILAAIEELVTAIQAATWVTTEFNFVGGTSRQIDLFQFLFVGNKKYNQELGKERFIHWLSLINRLAKEHAVIDLGRTPLTDLQKTNWIETEKVLVHNLNAMQIIVNAIRDKEGCADVIR